MKVLVSLGWGESKIVCADGRVGEVVEDEVCAIVWIHIVVPPYRYLISLSRATSTSFSKCILVRVEEFHSPKILLIESSCVHILNKHIIFVNNM